MVRADEAFRVRIRHTYLAELFSRDFGPQ